MSPCSEAFGDLLRVAGERLLPAGTDRVVGGVEEPGTGAGSRPVGSHDVVAGRGPRQRPVVVHGLEMVFPGLVQVRIRLSGRQRLGLGLGLGSGLPAASVCRRRCVHGERAVRLAQPGGQAGDAPVAGAEVPGPREVPGVEVAGPSEPVLVQQAAQRLVVLAGAADQGAFGAVLDDQPAGLAVPGRGASGLGLICGLPGCGHGRLGRGIRARCPYFCLAAGAGRGCGLIGEVCRWCRLARGCGLAAFRASSLCWAGVRYLPGRDITARVCGAAAGGLLRARVRAAGDRRGNLAVRMRSCRGLGRADQVSFECTEAGDGLVVLLLLGEAAADLSAGFGDLAVQVPDRGLDAGAGLLKAGQPVFQPGDDAGLVRQFAVIQDQRYGMVGDSVQGQGDGIGVLGSESGGEGEPADRAELDAAFDVPAGNGGDLLADHLAEPAAASARLVYRCPATVMANASPRVSVRRASAVSIMVMARVLPAIWSSASLMV